MSKGRNAAALDVARPEDDVNKLQASLKQLSLRGRQLFSTQMSGGGQQPNARAQKLLTLPNRGEKRGQKDIPAYRKWEENDDESTTSDEDTEEKENDEDNSDYSDDDTEGEDTALGMMPGFKKASSKGRGAWTREQDEALRIAVEKYEGKNWKAIATEVPGNRSHIQCLQRWGKVLKPGLIKGPWTEEEDELLRHWVPLETKGNWVAVAEHIPGRTAKQCRERWSLCLDPAIKKDPWTEEEDDLLLQLHVQYGNAWATIAKHLPGRTENATKSRFKSIERKRDRAWTPAEDATIIKGKAEERKWSAIAAMLPKTNRTKHAVKTRWKELMEINPALKRFDSGKSRSTSSSDTLLQRQPSTVSSSDSGHFLPSFNHMAAVAAASTPPEMFSTIYIPPVHQQQLPVLAQLPQAQPAVLMMPAIGILPPPIHGDSSPPHPALMSMAEANDESATFPTTHNLTEHTLSSDKLLNLRIQRNESFEDWLSREAGGITGLPMMTVSGQGLARPVSDEQMAGQFNFSYEDMNDLELV